MSSAPSITREQALAVIERKQRAWAERKARQAWIAQTRPAAKVAVEQRARRVRVYQAPLSQRVRIYANERKLAAALQADAGFDFFAHFGEVDELHEWDAAKGLCDPSVKATDHTVSLADRLIGDELRSEQLDAMQVQPYHVVEERMEHLRGSYLGVSTRTEDDVNHEFAPVEETYSVWEAEHRHEAQWAHGMHVAKAVGAAGLDKPEFTVAYDTGRIPPERVQAYCKTLLRWQHAGRGVLNYARPIVPLKVTVNGETYSTRAIAGRLDAELSAEREARVEAWKAMRRAQHPARSYDADGNRIWTQPARGIVATSARGLSGVRLSSKPEPKLKTLIERDPRTPWERYYRVERGGLA